MVLRIKKLFRFIGSNNITSRRYQFAPTLYWFYKIFPLPNEIKKLIKNDILWRFPIIRKTIFKGLKDDWYKIDSSGANSPILRIPPTGDDWVIMADQRVPISGKADEVALFDVILTILLDLGYKVTVISRLNKTNYQEISGQQDILKNYEEDLSRKGVSIIYGVDDFNAHLLEEGYKYKMAILSNPEASFEFNPLVRAYAINAEVLYVADDLKRISSAHEGAKKNGEAMQNIFDPLIKMACINIDCSDRVIVMSETEKEQILALAPDKNIDVFLHPDSFGPFIKNTISLKSAENK
ncbi:MAG: hypothetical protein ACQ9MH_09190 [Nitrospinales bacterium]